MPSPEPPTEPPTHRPVPEAVEVGAAVELTIERLSRFWRFTANRSTLFAPPEWREAVGGWRGSGKWRSNELLGFDAL